MDTAVDPSISCSKSIVLPRVEPTDTHCKQASTIDFRYDSIRRHVNRSYLVISFHFDITSDDSYKGRSRLGQSRPMKP